jgi:hypothetical protein
MSDTGRTPACLRNLPAACRRHVPADSSSTHTGGRSIRRVRVKSGPRQLLIALGLAVVAAGVSRWTLSGGEQHDEVPVVCTLVIDGCVLAWMLLIWADRHTGRPDP